MRSSRWAMVLLVVTACVGSPGVDTQPMDSAPSSEAAAPSTTVAPAPTTSSTNPATSSTNPATTSTNPATTRPSGGAAVPAVVIADGEVDGPGSVDVTLGEETAFAVTSDVELELHVHGYDLVFEIGAGETIEVRFVADVPGIFEVETHPGDLMVVSIVVEP